MLRSIISILQGRWRRLIFNRIDKKLLLLKLVILLFLFTGFGAGHPEREKGTSGGHSKRLANKTEGYKKMVNAKKVSNEEGKHLLNLARETIKNELDKKKIPPIDWENISDKFKENLGTFVTLTIDGNLRGCIGHIIPRETLIEGVKENSINAAFRDPRFPPLAKREFEKIEIEVSILTYPEELTYKDGEDLLNKLRPGTDGVIIKKDFYEATFLPQVWEQLPSKEEFLSHLCMKAGLPANSWKEEKLHVSTYQVQAFEEKKQEQ